MVISRTIAAAPLFALAVAGFCAPQAVAQQGDANAPGAAASTSATAPGSAAPASTAPPASTAAMSASGSLTIAPSTDSPSFDLSRTIQMALQSSSQIQIQKRQIDIDGQRVDEAEAQDRPQIAGNGRASRYDSATIIGFPSGGTVIPITFQKANEQDLSISFNERLDLLGQVRAARSQERLQQAEDRATLEQTVDARALQAKAIYFQLLRAQHQVEVTQSALADAKTQESISQRLFDNQVGQKIDLLRAQTSSDEAQQDLTAAQNGLEVARATFNDIVGRPLDAPIAAQDVSGATVGVDIRPTDASVGESLDQTLPGFTPYSVPTSEVAAIDVARSIAAAQIRRPEILEAAATVHAAEIGVGIAREGLEPTFAVSAVGNYYPHTDFAFPRQKTAAFTVSASIPFYDGGLTRDKVKEARMRTDQARSSLDAARENVALDVRESYLNLQTSAQQVSTTSAALAQAIAARQLAQIRYAGQVGLFLEVSDAQAALTRAESSQVDAVYAYLTARAQFENALGVPPKEQTNTLSAGGAPPAGATIGASAGN